MKNLKLIALLLISICTYSQNFWNQLNGPFGSYGLSSFAIDSSDNIYAVCRDVYKSTDYGNNWIKFYSSFAYSDAIAIHPNGNFFLSANERIYKSVDSGINWEELIHTYFHSFNFLINSKGYVFAGTDNDGIFISTNNGLNWFHKLEGTDIGSLIVDSNKFIFAATNQHGLYRSTDDGFNWVRIAFDNMRVNSLAINSANTIFACANSNIYKSEDGGFNWISINYGLPFNEYSGLYNGINNYLYCANMIGIYRSTDYGKNWIKISNDIGNHSFYPLIQSKNGILFAGCSGKAVYKSVNFGLNWILSNVGINNSYIQSILVINTSNIICGAQENGFFYSTNQGLSWDSSNFNNGSYNSNYNEIAIDNFGKLYAGMNNKLYASSDSGRTWIYISTPSGCDIVNIIFSTDNTLFLNSHGCALRKSTNGGLIWSEYPIGGSNGVLGKNFNGDLYFTNLNSLYRSTNNGINWTQLPSLMSNWINCIKFNENNNIYLGFSNGILYSSNHGQSWSQIFSTTTLPVSKIVLTANYIFAMPYEDHYIYYSSNNGFNWFQLGSGLENKNVTTLTGDSSGTLYCGTLNHGMFKGLESLISVNPVSKFVPSYFKLYDNYPNPFNPQTRIKFDVPEESFININIYNSVGQLVVALVQQNYKSGQYDIDWNAENYPSGIYFCNFRANNYNLTNKLILIK